MTTRIIEDLLKHGDKHLGLPRPISRMRLGMGKADLTPPSELHHREEDARVAWLRHLEAGRIGGVNSQLAPRLR